MSAKNWDAISYKPEQANTELSNDLDSFLKWINGWDNTTPEYLATRDMMIANGKDVVTEQNITVESDHLSEFSASVGLYFNLPLGKRFSIGTKALVGRSIMQELDLDANYKGNIKDIGFNMNIVDGEPTSLEITRFNSTKENYDVTWDFMTMGGKTSFTYGTGISLTYRYKSNFSWKVFADYDYSRKIFTLKHDSYRYLRVATPHMEELYAALSLDFDPLEFEKTKKMHYYWWLIYHQFLIGHGTRDASIAYQLPYPVEFIVGSFQQFMSWCFTVNRIDHHLTWSNSFHLFQPR